MTEESCETYWIKIYIAGPIEVAKQIIREECYREGLCATIEPTDFIYTGGEEKGYVVGLINYPRFPASKESIWQRSEIVLNLLLDKTYQKSALMMSPTNTKWISKKEKDD